MVVIRGVMGSREIDRVDRMAVGVFDALLVRQSFM